LPRVVATGIAVACVAGFCGFFLPHFRAEAWRKPARGAIDALARVPADAAHYRAPLEQARAALERATALDLANGQAWADLSYALALSSVAEPAREAELGKAAEAAAVRALACSRVSHEFWIRRGVARDMQGRWVEAGEDFLVAVRLAPHNTWAWYYYAEHLSRVWAVREAADAAVAFCLRLDPWNPLGIALRQRLAIAPKAP
jgi:tetratricopeptide (TPR) repeat protein